MSRVLCIDFGLKRCGIAVTDELRIIASGLAQVASTELEKYLDDYMAKEDVGVIVIGYPTRHDGRDAHVTPNVRMLQKHLQTKYPQRTIDLQDERFTSAMASKSMLEMGMKKSKRKEKGMVDEISAVLILQAWMQRQS